MPTVPALDALATIRRRSGLTRSNIASLTAAAGREITIARQKELENGPHRAEPWLDEALDLASILLTGGITPLMASEENPSGNLTLFDLGPSVASERDLLVRGVRLPLSMACRICVEFGLSDPADLQQRSIHQQIWDTLQHNERGAAPLECPWCGSPAGQEHAPHCLPANIWQARSTAPYLLTDAPTPRVARTRGTARLAHGLKGARSAAKMRQIDLANAIGMHPNYLARIERLDAPLTDANAENIARVLERKVADLFGPAENAGQ